MLSCLRRWHNYAVALESLGLCEEQERVYRALVEMAAAGVEELAARSAVAATEVATILDELQIKGLVARSTGDDAVFVPSPPDVALAALLVERQEALRRAQVQVAELSALYASAGGRRGGTEVIDVVQGIDAIAQRFSQLQRGATSSVQALVKSAVAAAAVDENVERMAIERGVKYSVVVEREIFDRPGFLASAEEAITAGTSLRVTQSLPLRAIIVDRSLALIPLASREHSVPITDALLVHPSGLLDVLLTAFDMIWADASPLELAADGPVEGSDAGLDPLDSRILHLLFAGLTDQAIANQLGMSLRTVQRRVRLMMDQAKVDTRLQLGYQAAKRDWI